MASYWIKHVLADSPLGPHTGSQLKSMAASGELTPSGFVSADQTKWVPAANVKGLFAAPVVSQLEQPPALPDDPQQQFNPIPLAAQPLAYATATFRPRNVQWYLICAIVLVGLAVVQLTIQFGSMFLIMSRLPSASRSSTVTVTTIGAGRTVVRTAAGPTPFPGWYFPLVLSGSIIRIVALAASLGLWIYFTIWAYQVHEDMQIHTNGAYPISPGKACGFCWIPFFNFYWIVYMPFKLAEAIDWHLGSTRQAVNPTQVMVFQILQEVVNFTCACLLTPAPIFFALTMRNI